jgi:hypothetical protein
LKVETIMRMASLLVTFALITSPAPAAEPEAWKAGVATQVITPAKPIWMAGYGSRNHPAEGKETDLFVKALALEAPDGGRLVLLTSDLVGVPRQLTEAVADAVRRRTGVPRDRMLFTVSHTHCGPVLRDNLEDMYPMPPEEVVKIGPYTDQLREWMIDVMVRSVANLKSARLAFGLGKATFAVNRRKPTPKGIINDANPDGPVDHAVPVLRVETPDAKLLAVAFGYACHNTTLQFYRWCGDYAGFAQHYIQEKHPGATAFFWMGCGGDANPLPRSTVELCHRYGHRLADAVEEVLEGKMVPIRGSAKVRYATVRLPLAEILTRERIVADKESKTHAIRRRAERLFSLLEGGGKIDDHYRYYPVQAWKLGDGPAWVALGGEVVVDYSLRLKRELGEAGPLWVTAYANDVMAYIPSARVLKEGGYEADSSMIYYGMPGKWAPEVEDLIVGKVHDLVRQVRSAADSPRDR